MPKAANWHLDDLMATLESYPLKTREHITFEYLLLGGVNDQPEHARELARLVSRVKGKLNLIAYNPSETQLYNCLLYTSQAGRRPRPAALPEFPHRRPASERRMALS